MKRFNKVEFLNQLNDEHQTPFFRPALYAFPEIVAELCFSFFSRKLRLPERLNYYLQAESETYYLHMRSGTTEK
jgi:hypothetical protein